MPERFDYLILGSAGFVGSNFLVEASRDHATIGHRRALPRNCRSDVRTIAADLSDVGAVGDVVREANARIVVNCIAEANIDVCERDAQRAELLNAQVPGELARACATVGSRFVHLSTDAVFGVGSGPFDEYDDPVPRSTYARTKLDGEQAALDADPTTLVLRTNVVGWSPSGHRSLLEYFHSGMVSGRPTPGFIDVSFRPLVPQHLWRILVRLVESGCSGVFHATGADYLTKYEFGTRVARVFGLDEHLVVRSSVKDSALVAPRSNTMDVGSARMPAVGLEPPAIDDGLALMRDLEASGHRALLAGLH